jgi:hypothetical protein
MAPRIVTQYTLKIPFDVGGYIRKLLRHVPPEHLLGLEEILIVDEVAHRQLRRTGASGLYHPRQDANPARIELGLSTVYHDMPRILLFVPFIKKFLLANALYHEIGHHYEHITHQQPKERKEDFASKYSTRMLTRAFYWWFLIFVPLRPVIKAMLRRAGRTP